MREAYECTTEELKNAVWNLNDGRCPGNGLMSDIEAIRKELERRTGSRLGYHETSERK